MVSHYTKRITIIPVIIIPWTKSTRKRRGNPFELPLKSALEAVFYQALNMVSSAWAMGEFVTL